MPAVRMCSRDLSDHAARAHWIEESPAEAMILVSICTTGTTGRAAMIGGVEAVDVGQRHAQVGGNQVAHERQRVVVAELDLIDGDGCLLS